MGGWSGGWVCWKGLGEWMDGRVDWLVSGGGRVDKCMGGRLS